jgi:hypothetical protein
MARLAGVLLLLTIAAIGVLYAIDYKIPISEDEAVQRELRLNTDTADLNRRVNDAIKRDDIDDATMFSDIAGFMGLDLPPETKTRLQNATSTVANVVRDTGQFATGFVTGEGLSMAGIAGAIAADLTVVGDVRDIAGEGAKLVQGKDYNELILGLSVVGVAATAATVATGGGGVVAKAGVSILKVAKRSGHLTVEFGRTLTRMTRDAVNLPELGRVLRNTNLSDLRATEAAVTSYAKTVKGAEIFPVVAKLNDISRVTSPSETVRLLKYVRTTENLDDIARMSARYGKKTRGIIEITGKAALRAFKTGLNIIEFIIEKILWFLGWLATLFGVGATKRVVRGVRGSRSAHAASGGGGGIGGVR